MHERPPTLKVLAGHKEQVMKVGKHAWSCHEILQIGSNIVMMMFCFQLILLLIAFLTF
jgi:hypothetical protein